MKYEDEKKKLMLSKNPEQYIENSWKSKLTAGQKSAITLEWLQKKGYTIQDIQYARNRNENWKKLKNKGNVERNAKRIEKYNFSKANSEKKVWKQADIEDFYKINSKMADWELAKKYKTTLPSINHIRRKFKLAENIMALKKEKPNAKKVATMAMTNEKSLRDIFQELSGKKKPKQKASKR